MSNETTVKTTAITNVHPETESYWGPGRFNVFVKCSLIDLIDRNFLQKHLLWDLPYKSAAWHALVKYVNREIIACLTPLIGARFNLNAGDFTLSYSRYAGCSCGCSPGYVGKILNARYEEIQALGRHNVWATVVVSQTITDAVLAEINKQAARLPEEKEREMAKLRVEAHAAGIEARRTDQGRRSNSWSRGDETSACPSYHNDESLRTAWRDGYAFADEEIRYAAIAKNTEAAMTSAAL